MDEHVRQAAREELWDRFFEEYDPELGMPGVRIPTDEEMEAAVDELIQTRAEAMYEHKGWGASQ